MPQKVENRKLKWQKIVIGVLKPSDYHSTALFFYNINCFKKNLFLSFFLLEFLSFLLQSNRQMNVCCGSTSTFIVTSLSRSHRRAGKIKLEAEKSVWGQFWLSARGQFHQRVYAKLLRSQIPKAQKAAWSDCLFCAFGLCAPESCA